MQKDHMREKVSKDLPGPEARHRIPLPNTRGTGEKRPDVSRVVAVDNEAMPYVVGESARMREIYTIIRKAAPWDANVCIEGENGTVRRTVRVQAGERTIARYEITGGFIAITSKFPVEVGGTM